MEAKSISWDSLSRSTRAQVEHLSISSANTDLWDAKSVSTREIRVVAILFIAEGVFYVAYAVWRTVLNRLEVYRAPPALETLAYAFFLAMLGAGIFFISRAFILLIGRTRLHLSDYGVSLCSFFLWGFPALISFGNAHSYLTTAPSSLRPYAYSNLVTGMFFALIGVINILSWMYMGLSHLNKDTTAFQTQERNSPS